VAVRLEDLLASFRRHLRAAKKAPRPIELYGQSHDSAGELRPLLRQTTGHLEKAPDMPDR
jgi:hypothetical protein